MLDRRLSILVLAAVGLFAAAVANAQVGLSTKPNYDATDRANVIDENAQRALRPLHEAGVEALQNKNYSAAEGYFGELLRQSPANADANFLMGLTKIGREKWTEAQKYLEIAAKLDPKRPEPKTRLGLTDIKLNDVDAARKQRAELADLDKDCKGACEDARWIADGLVLLDHALAPNSPVAAPARTVPADVVLIDRAAASPNSGAPAAAVASATLAPSPLAATPAGFDPAEYSMVTFSDPHDLYDLLTKEGRCPPNQVAEPKQPCALILYTPVDDAGDALSANFKPVFKVVSRNMIWAIHNKKLQTVKLEDLYFDEDKIVGKKRNTYRSVALVGNTENATNCEQARPCLAHLVAQDMFAMYSNMPDSVVQVIWPSGMKDPGTARVR